MSKQMNHAEYQKKASKMTNDELRFTIKDCRECLSIWPDSDNASYYADEICYCSMELNKRAI